MTYKKPEIKIRRRPFHALSRKQKPPNPGEEFTGEWIYLAHILETIAKDLSRENRHTEAVEQFFRAKQIWTGVVSVDPHALTPFLSLVISLIRELIVIERIEDAHDICIQMINQWETSPLSPHERLLLTHIRYCKALIAVECTLYDEAISEYEAVLSIWGELSDEDMSLFLPIIRQATLALQQLYQMSGDQKVIEHLQTHAEECKRSSSENERTIDLSDIHDFGSARKKSL